MKYKVIKIIIKTMIFLASIKLYIAVPVLTGSDLIIDGIYFWVDNRTNRFN